MKIGRKLLEVSLYKHNVVDGCGNRNVENTEIARSVRMLKKNEDCTIRLYFGFGSVRVELDRKTRR